MAIIKRIKLRRHSKRPIDDNWPAIPEAADIRDHVRRGGNVGYQTGGDLDLLIVDVDDREAATPFLTRWDTFLRTCPRVRTASGKMHFYMSYPDGVMEIPSRIGGGRTVPGIDLVADGGHQIVAPPSIVIDPERDINGQYMWETANTITNCNPPQIPLSMLEEFSQVLAPEHGADEDFGIRTPTGPANAGMSPLDEETPIPSGERNETMARIASELIRRSGQQDAEQIMDAMLMINAERCQPPLPESEVVTIARSMCRRDRRQHPDRVPRPVVTEEEIQAAEVAPPPEPLEFGDDADFGGVEPVMPAVPASISEFLRMEFLPFIDTPRPDSTKADANACARWMMANVFGPGLIVLGEQYLIRDSRYRLWREVPKAHVASAVQAAFDSTRARTENIVYSLTNMSYYPRADYPMWYTRTGTRPEGYPDDPRALIPFRNGLLNVEDFTLLPHTPNLVTLAQMPFDYDPTAVCPRWEQFLAELWDSATSERAIALQMFFGYCMIPDTTQHKFMTLHGKRRGGKSTIAKILHSLIGDHGVTACSLNSLTTPHGLGPLVGKNLAIFYDAHLPSHGGGMLIESLKSLAAGDPQQINRKYMDQYTARLNVRLLVVCNEIPRMEDADSALAARMIPVRCDRSFFGQEDTQLPERLARELPGIANWALRGLRQYRQEGRLFMPREGLEDLATLRRATNPVAAFMEDCCEVIPFPEDDPSVGPVSGADLFGAWNRWCVEKNYRNIGTQMRLLDKIRNVAPELVISRRGVRDFISGIRLLTNSESHI